MISHRNVIANATQLGLHDAQAREELGVDTQQTMGLLPFSHIYALVVITHTGTYRGDGITVLPRFELKTFLASIQKYKVNKIPVVSPLLTPP